MESGLTYWSNLYPTLTIVIRRRLGSAAVTAEYYFRRRAGPGQAGPHCGEDSIRRRTGPSQTEPSRERVAGQAEPGRPALLSRTVRQRMNEWLREASDEVMTSDSVQIGPLDCDCRNRREMVTTDSYVGEHS